MATILIVDDEEPIRDLLAALLEGVGHRALGAIHGAQALEMAAKEPLDLVISDIMMPVLNGTELCHRLKAGADRRLIPVILMSSAGSRTVNGSGADAFIAKPFLIEEMAELVRRWLPPESGQDDPAQ